MRDQGLLTPATGLAPGLDEIGAVSKSFARHETFHPRYGWIKKGFDAVADDPGVFLADDAPLRLGVGKNMVRAIRYWTRAFKVVDEYPNPERPRSNLARPTEFGNALLGENGWDPYLEHPGSLWLLHWMLLRPTSHAPTWYFVFNLLPAQGFTENEAVAAAVAFRDTQIGWEKVGDRSLQRDISCLLRMYVGGTRLVRDPDEGIDSPFSDLRLIRLTDGSVRHYSLSSGDKPTLPGGILAAACADYIHETAGVTAQSVALRRLAYDEAGPGRAFRLSETDLRTALERFDPSERLFRIVDPAGVQQIVLQTDTDTIRKEALASVYGQGTAEVTS